MGSPLVIYHGADCLDGFGSAYAAYAHFKLELGIEAEYIAAKHGDPAPNASQRDVYLLDFAYSAEVTRELCRQANSVVVLDHHISAQRNLAGLDDTLENLSLNFDMNRSGAVITWQYFHKQPVPYLLELIQDRDLWRFQYSETEDINAALMSYPKDFLQWHYFATEHSQLTRLVNEGVAINRFRQQQVAHFKTRAVMGKIAGYQVPIVNCPAAIASELLSELAEGYPFAAGYVDKGTKRGWSLRSRDGGANVADIAGLFGGGGHPRAAGFATQISADLLVVEPNDIIP